MMTGRPFASRFASSPRNPWTDTDEHGREAAVVAAPQTRMVEPETALSQRRGEDSNPRDACTPNGFRDRRIRPLCHPSGVESLADRLPLPVRTRTLNLVERFELPRLDVAPSEAGLADECPRLPRRGARRSAGRPTTSGEGVAFARAQDSAGEHAQTDEAAEPHHRAEDVYEEEPVIERTVAPSTIIAASRRADDSGLTRNFV